MRSEPAFLVKAVDAAIRAGAQVINIPDTVGYATPDEMAAMITLPERECGEHRQGDAVRALPQRPGPGGGQLAGRGRRGRAAGGMHHQRHRRARGQRGAGRARDGDAHPPGSLPRSAAASTPRASAPTSRLVYSILGVNAPINKAIVGQNAFAHEAGIHQHGVMANRATYEIMTPGIHRPDAKPDGAGQAQRPPRR